MRIVLVLILASTVYCQILRAQPIRYTLANAHSHNDYEQAQPFFLAYQEGFGSIEADIHLVDNKLLVAHDKKHLSPNVTLEKLYLDPIADFIKRNNGSPYADSSKTLQLLIDIKTDSISTLDSLITHLKKYPSIINNHKINITITGNRPDPSTYIHYPSFIWFDGRPTGLYSKEAFSKIALISDDFGNYVKKRYPLEISAEENQHLIEVIKFAHDHQKKFRFWGVPDYQVAWEKMITLSIDFINTDHINTLSDFLIKHNKDQTLMPFNRIIHSAGEVVRFGKPDLENHALDLAVLPDEDAVVVEDRYGITAIHLGSKKILDRWAYNDDLAYRNRMSVYSGIKIFSVQDKNYVLWTAAEAGKPKAALMIAEWNAGFKNISEIPLEKKSPANNALPNELTISKEKEEWFVYVVLNGNNELIKLKWADRSIVWKKNTGVAPYGITMANEKIYVTNWAGHQPTDSAQERAGVPWGLAYTDPRTGATASGSVSVFDLNGNKLHTINVGLHPNAIKASADGKLVYVSNGSSDLISVIQTKSDLVTDQIQVGLLKGKDALQGNSPNGLELSKDGKTLYVANGFDNAVAVVNLSKKQVAGYIPTEAYPAAIKLVKDRLVVCNLESDGANLIDAKKGARQIHQQLASISIIPVPDNKQLAAYTQEVAQLNVANRFQQWQLPARENRAPVPVPERLGEPSVFKHVIYIIKENKTYDQVFGDMSIGKNDSTLCIYGNRITPNMHALARQFGWMDDYYASGKSSAEGHQWTDAGMVSDYVEKNVRAWFRSYPHRQADALVYNQSGFIWNHALDHGKSVRIYGEACETQYNTSLKWADLYRQYQAGKKPDWFNSTTIARIRPIISATYPDCDNIAFSDQQRVDVFAEEWKSFEQQNHLPDLLILSLPNDHTSGTSPNFPTPNAMVADNDLAVGRVVDMVSKSKFWDSTVIFITQDDSQSGWDHISAYRTVGLTISPYSSGKLISTNYNQTSMLRTIEQILGIPPMNIIDASARLMVDCFQPIKKSMPYQYLPNQIPLNEMNKDLNALSGKARKFAKQSQDEIFRDIDNGEDDKMNKILWFYAKGNTPYPANPSKTVAPH